MTLAIGWPHDPGDPGSDHPRPWPHDPGDSLAPWPWRKRRSLAPCAWRPTKGGWFRPTGSRKKRRWSTFRLTQPNTTW